MYIGGLLYSIQDSHTLKRDNYTLMIGVLLFNSNGGQKYSINYEGQLYSKTKGGYLYSIELETTILCNNRDNSTLYI